MTELECQIELWHRNRFGPDVDIPATYKKLLEEVGELGEAIMGGNEDSIREEAGDVAMVLHHIVRACCPGSPSLHSALSDSLKKCEYRLTSKEIVH